MSNINWGLNLMPFLFKKKWIKFHERTKNASNSVSNISWVKLFLLSFFWLAVKYFSVVVMVVNDCRSDVLARSWVSTIRNVLWLHLNAFNFNFNEFLMRMRIIEYEKRWDSRKPVNSIFSSLNRHKKARILVLIRI